MKQSVKVNRLARSLSLTLETTNVSLTLTGNGSKNYVGTVQYANNA